MSGGRRINWSEEHLDARCNVSYYSGHHAGAEDAAKYLLTKAGDAFSHGNDELAKMLRQAAADIRKDVAKQYDKYVKENEAALAELEKKDEEYQARATKDKSSDAA